MCCSKSQAGSPASGLGVDNQPRFPLRGKDVVSMQVGGQQRLAGSRQRQFPQQRDPGHSPPTAGPAIRPPPGPAQARAAPGPAQCRAERSISSAYAGPVWQAAGSRTVPDPQRGCLIPLLAAREPERYLEHQIGAARAGDRRRP
jgi:hypothetical protein